MDERKIAAAVLVSACVVKQRLQLAAVIEALLNDYAEGAAIGREPSSAWFLLQRHRDFMT